MALVPLPLSSRRVADFLGKSLTADQVARLADYLSIKNMKKNPAVNHADRHEKLVPSAPEESRRGSPVDDRPFPCLLPPSS